MALASHTLCLLLLLLLLGPAWKTVGSAAHSLCLNLTVTSHSPPGQPWCAAQGSVDGNPFLQYNCDSHKVTPLGPLGEKVKATETWTDLTQTLGEVGRELRMILPDIKLETTRTRGPPTLQAKLSCQHEAQGGTGASWEFSINGQRALLFDGMSGKWLAIDPGASGVREEWENNQQLTEHFRRISRGDCSHWLREFLPHWEEMLEPTVPPTKTPETNQSNWIMSSILIPTIFFIIVIGSIIAMKVKPCRRRSGASGGEKGRGCWPATLPKAGSVGMWPFSSSQPDPAAPPGTWRISSPCCCPSPEPGVLL
ncbi:retinoic acid early transcript 1E-like [Talpa occidentalis]|uniref:retinoic acid early transcript 1E-like n=1 Tax=Talpa occidentalis TaxID=50954 RepID=UPI0023F99475|nr:retinoic acid early transcript 1E-like [Talpa occidentalis]